MKPPPSTPTARRNPPSRWLVFLQWGPQPAPEAVSYSCHSGTWEGDAVVAAIGEADSMTWPTFVRTWPVADGIDVDGGA